MKYLFIIFSVFILSCKSVKTTKKDYFFSEKHHFSIDTINNNLYVNTDAKFEINSNNLPEIFRYKRDKTFNYDDFVYLNINGSRKKIALKTYTKNLVQNPFGSNNNKNWLIDESCRINTDSTTCIFEVINFKNNTGNSISQNINFTNSNFSNKYLLFICEATTEKYIENSITRTPYL